MIRLFALLILTALAFPSLCQGTTIVFVISNNGDYVVLAADSRDFWSYGHPSDSACKIVAFKDTLFYESGAATALFKDSKWDAVESAKGIYKRSKTHDAEMLSIIWGNEAMKFFNAQPDSFRRRAEGQNSNGGVVTGGFINFNALGNPVASAQTVTARLSDHQLFLKPTTEHTGQIGTSGVGHDLIAEFINARSSRALRAHGAFRPHLEGSSQFYDIQLVQQAIQFVIDNSTGEDKRGVNGPIDVAVLTRDGAVKWVTRKQDCYAFDIPQPKRKQVSR
jgi:hypothetical protein